MMQKNAEVLSFFLYLFIIERFATSEGRLAATPPKFICVLDGIGGGNGGILLHHHLARFHRVPFNQLQKINTLRKITDVNSII